jgi:hypothetical protein
MFGGPVPVDEMFSASRVDCTRIGPLPNNVDWRKAEPRDYPAIGQPTTVPREAARRIAGTLTAAESYGWDYAKSCTPVYSVMITFHCPNNRIDVLFCFSCDVLAIARDGHVTGGGNIEYVRRKLVRLIKELFPYDPLIQSLPEVRGARADQRRGDATATRGRAGLAMSLGDMRSNDAGGMHGVKLWIARRLRRAWRIRGAVGFGSSIGSAGSWLNVS